MAIATRKQSVNASLPLATLRSPSAPLRFKLHDLTLERSVAIAADGFMIEVFPGQGNEIFLLAN